MPSSERTAVPRKRATTGPAEGLDIAARYFVYKLYDATVGQRTRWQVLHEMGESAASIARAVERGWVVLQGEVGAPMQRQATLTDEGRRLGRKVRGM